MKAMNLGVQFKMLMVSLFGQEGLEALGKRNFRVYLWGQVPSIVGIGLQVAALPLWVYEKTGSEMAVGWLLSTNGVIALCFIGGVIADRYNRRNLLFIGQWLAFAHALAMATIVYQGWFNLPAVLALNIAAGLITVLDHPARQAFKIDLVGSELRESAVAVFSALDGVAFATGLALAGLIIQLAGKWGIVLCLVLNAATYLLANATLWLIKPAATDQQSEALPPFEGLRARQPQQGRRSLWTIVKSMTADFWRQFWQGASFTVVHPEALSVMLRTVVLVFFGTRCTVLLPAYAAKILHDDASYGWLTACGAIGGVVGSLAAMRLRNRITHLQWSGFALWALLPLALLVVATTNILPLACAALCAATALASLINAHCQTCLQGVTSPGLQGRVVSLRTGLTWTVDLVGTLLIAWVSTIFGIRSTMIAWAIAGGLLGSILVKLERRTMLYTDQS